MYYIYIYISMGFSGGASGKEPACQCRRHKRCKLDPWIWEPLKEGNGNPLQYSWLENPMDRGAWRAMVHWGLQRAGYYLSDLALMHSSAVKDTVRKQTLIAAVLTCKYSLYFLHRAPDVFKCSLLIPCIPQALAFHSFLPLYRMAWDCA